MKMRSLTVSKLNSYIKSLFSNDGILSNVSVEGEISNYKEHSSGHLYFSLKDQESRIMCVMFKGNTTHLNFNPADGKSVIVKGYVSLYEKTGQYQLYVQDMEVKGEGDLYLQFEKLKRQLYEKGWFNQNVKMPIPTYPKRIAIVTSKTGAAIRDIISVITRRNPTVSLYVYSVLVQGENAKYDIARAIEKINETQAADVIILSRGGGSIEELWAFNELIVAQSIYRSEIPIISGVGHETDFTIADFVADLRAPTPSAAAELAVGSLVELKERLYTYKTTVYKQMLRKLEIEKNHLTQIKNHYTIKRPLDILYQYRQQLDLYENRLENILKKTIHERRVQLLNYKSHLNDLYSQNQNGFIENIRGEQVKSVKEVEMHEELILRLKDGHLKVKIEEINEGFYERKNI
ncbi:exodeoxyribonuclease VII large subunit [Alkalibaculum bacchi]|uniref:Exodeoxyribonuclease 7 large subunit n=1 Tax=Alkalibaculum bacchi TaxID=645887 RepID=A0A366I4R2_9FIRM|nr:exodeoxyribonuclease VII large subunit [Alkalibaculum bacchi]RBP61791.1 exodeoxyribonuclease VII large subunit [Alkalibaculum bacchi]